MKDSQPVISPGFRALMATIIVVLTMGLPVQSMVAAQSSGEATSYNPELLNLNIQISGPNFALQDVALEEYPHGRGERVYISGVNTLAFAEIAFFDDADTPQQTIAVMLSEFESTSQSFAIIDEGTKDGVSYALAQFQISDDFGGYFYIEVVPDISENTDIAQSMYTINEDFLGQLELARGEISIAGNAFLGETVIDLEALITAHQDEATAEAQATPAVSSIRFTWFDTELIVKPPVTFDYPLKTVELEAAYISATTGFGFAGYMRQESSSPEEVIQVIFADTPAGDESPDLLHVQQEREHAWAVYRIAIDGGFRIMVIEVSNVGTDLWQIEALAVDEADFLAELAVFQQSVTIGGTPFLDSFSVETIDEILTTNQP